MDMDNEKFYAVRDSKIVIRKTKLLRFLENLGYRKLLTSTNDFELVKVSKGSIVEKGYDHMMATDIRKYLEEKDEERVFEEILGKDYTSKSLLKNLKSVSIEFSQGNKNESIFFYKNGVVKITADNYRIIPYDEYEGFLWKEQISERDFTPNSKYRSAAFAKFVYNLSGKDIERFKSLRSIIGYMLHSYKDQTFSPAVILLDEDVDVDNEEAKGGKGKSLLVEGIGKVVSYYFKDGKTLKNKNQFQFSGYQRYQKIISFDDVNPNFDFESLFSVITGHFSLEKKYENEKIIPFSESPKFIISSNYMLDGVRGYSSDRRKIEFEISSHYGRHLTPIEEFGCRFFDDWDIEEWSKFDSFMIMCAKEYLSSGLTIPQSINLVENKLRKETHPKFIAFVKEEIKKSGRYNKKDLFEKFREQYRKEVFGVSPHQFTKWIRIWAEHNGHFYDIQKSNSKQYIEVKLKGN
ncbi:primase-helicase family protein [Galbibacter sp.]|uniref:primase-helicase family protein n=1 Tax=Galbibacter sp. TaxID=2918471 RepID=UPI003A935673